MAEIYPSSFSGCYELIKSLYREVRTLKGELADRPVSVDVEFKLHDLIYDHFSLKERIEASIRNEMELRLYFDAFVLKVLSTEWSIENSEKK